MRGCPTAAWAALHQPTGSCRLCRRWCRHYNNRRGVATSEGQQPRWRLRSNRPSGNGSRRRLALQIVQPLPSAELAHPRTCLGVCWGPRIGPAEVSCARQSRSDQTGARTCVARHPRQLVGPKYPGRRHAQHHHLAEAVQVVWWPGVLAGGLRQGGDPTGWGEQLAAAAAAAATGGSNPGLWHARN